MLFIQDKKANASEEMQQLGVSKNPEMDPIISRLRGITRANEESNISSSFPTPANHVNSNKDKINIVKRLSSKEMSLTQEISDQQISFMVDLNTNNSLQHPPPPENIDYPHDYLNKNNTAISAEDDSCISFNKAHDYVVDNFQSVTLCDANNKIMTLTDKNSDNRETVRDKYNSSFHSQLNSNDALRDILTATKFQGKKLESGCLSDKLDNEDVTNMKGSKYQDKQVYHQYLVAEKPIVESSCDSQKSQADDTSSETSERNIQRQKSKSRRRDRNNTSIKDQRGKSTSKHTVETDSQRDLRIREPEQAKRPDNSPTNLHPINSPIEVKSGTSSQNEECNDSTVKCHAENLEAKSKFTGPFSHNKNETKQKLQSKTPIPSPQYQGQSRIEKAVGQVSTI